MVKFVQKTEASNFYFQYSFNTSVRFCKNLLDIGKSEINIFQFSLLKIYLLFGLRICHDASNLVNIILKLFHKKKLH